MHPEAPEIDRTTAREAQAGTPLPKRTNQARTSCGGFDTLHRMAYQLDSEMQSRLARHYQQVSDAELLDSVARLDDLTPMAQEVVHAELNARGLQRAWSDGSSASASARDIAPQEEWLPDPYGTSRPTLPRPEFGSPIEKGRIALITLYDAMDAGQACDALDQDGIDVEVRDLSQAEGGGFFYGGRPVALQLIVGEQDRDRAVTLLRQKMGLFPLEQIAEPDTIEDDGTIATVGQFARRSDAEDVARVLTDAKVWNRITPNPDGSAETEDAFLVEVREVDLIGAGELVEKALNLPEA